jgi:hypothetical protein
MKKKWNSGLGRRKGEIGIYAIGLRCVKCFRFSGREFDWWSGV